MKCVENWGPIVLLNSANKWKCYAYLTERYWIERDICMNGLLLTWITTKLSEVRGRVKK